jgi:hypothetical protein
MDRQTDRQSDYYRAPAIRGALSNTTFNSLKNEKQIKILTKCTSSILIQTLILETPHLKIVRGVK